MNAYNQSASDKIFLHRSLEATIRIGLLLIIIVWCFKIVEPFIIPIIWGIIIAVAAHPLYSRLRMAFGERHKLAATAFTIAFLIILIVPTVLLTETLIDGLEMLAEKTRDGSLSIPPPPENLGNLMVIGQPLARFWLLASENIQSALQQLTPVLRVIGSWLLSAAAGGGMAILHFVVAIIIAGILLANSSGNRTARAITRRLSDEKGDDYADLAEATVRSVANGILGVALIQSILAGLGFMVAGVPAAGLWALLCLILSIAQIGLFTIVIPIIIYLFYTADMFTAVAFLIWSIPVGLLDSILKPILLGRGVKTPMAVIFIGAIGGLLSSGVIGLFHWRCHFGSWLRPVFIVAQRLIAGAVKLISASFSDF
ncbi:MAG: AI-2E family transporter [Methylococcales bacterium]|nr:AI-2E family transporter [Methylococcales bacterium]